MRLLHAELAKLARPLTFGVAASAALFCLLLAVGGTHNAVLGAQGAPRHLPSCAAEGVPAGPWAGWRGRNRPGPGDKRPENTRHQQEGDRRSRRQPVARPGLPGAVHDDTPGLCGCSAAQPGLALASPAVAGSRRAWRRSPCHEPADGGL